ATPTPSAPIPSSAPSATSPTLLAVLGSAVPFAAVGADAAELPVVLTSTGGAAAPTCAASRGPWPCFSGGGLHSGPRHPEAKMRCTSGSCAYSGSTGDSWYAGSNPLGSTYFRGLLRT